MVASVKNTNRNEICWPQGILVLKKA